MQFKRGDILNFKPGKLTVNIDQLSPFKVIFLRYADGIRKEKRASVYILHNGREATVSTRNLDAYKERRE